MKIVVIGGSGLIGKKLVSRLSQKGHDVVAASPDSGVNTVTGEGLAEALAGARVVVDVANSPSFDTKVALDFFVAGGAHPACRGSRRRRGASRCALRRRHRTSSGVWLLWRQAGSGKSDQGLRDSLHDRPLDAVLRIHRRDRSIGHCWANGSRVSGPFPAHRVR